MPSSPIKFRCLCIVALIGALTPSVHAEPEDTTVAVRAAIERGAAFLLRAQNADGSWGGAHDSITTWSGWTWSNPETHHVWRVATTGLCVSALYQTGSTPAALDAADRGVRYLIASGDVRRPSDWDTMNSWAYIYGLQGFAAALAHERHADSALRREIALQVPVFLTKLARFQSLNGGWGYLEFDLPRTRQPQWATSFMTAAAVVAVEMIRDQGFKPDDAVVARAVRIIKQCRLPNGAYTYRVRNVPNLNSTYIDQVKGSLSRIQVCQAALMMAGEEVSAADREFGLEQFFRHHKFLDIAMHKPVPHEAYYYNSGYFYLFGHYYAALVIEQMPPAEQRLLWPQLQHEIIKVQQQDGSMWDYDMHGYDRPYGTAFGILGLGRSLTNQLRIVDE